MTTVEATGIDVGEAIINLAQLQTELIAAGVSVAKGLTILGPGQSVASSDPKLPTGCRLFNCDAQGQPADFPSADVLMVEQTVAAHIALRDKTDAEYSVEFQDPATTAVRRQDIRDITAGLLPREQVRVDNGQPLNPPPPQEDPLETIKSVPLGSTTDELRDAIVAYLERFGG